MKMHKKDIQMLVVKACFYELADQLCCGVTEDNKGATFQSRTEH